MLTKSVDNAFDSIRQAMPDESYPFMLSWSHYLILMRIKNDDERRFYEIESSLLFLRIKVRKPELSEIKGFC